MDESPWLTFNIGEPILDLKKYLSQFQNVLFKRLEILPWRIQGTPIQLFPQKPKLFNSNLLIMLIDNSKSSQQILTQLVPGWHQKHERWMPKKG